MRPFSSDSHSPLLGLKGFAILLVLLYHCVPSLYKIGTGICWIGVDLLLVLLGYHITSVLLTLKSRPEALSHFFLRHTVPLLVLYGIGMAIFFLVLPFCMPLDWIRDYLAYYDHQIWYWLGISNWLVTFQHHWPVVVKPILDHTWLFSLEIQLYLLWPFAVLFLPRRFLFPVCVFLILFSFVSRNLFENRGLNYAVSYVCTLGRLDGVCLGALVALIAKEEQKNTKWFQYAPWTFYIAVVLLLGLIVGSRSLSLKHPYFIRYGYTVLAILFTALLLLSLKEGTWAHKLTKNRAFLFLGNYGESIYLVHWFLYILLTDFFSLKFGFFSSPLLQSLANSVACLLCILAVAFVLEKLTRTLVGKPTPAATSLP